MKFLISILFCFAACTSGKKDKETTQEPTTARDSTVNTTTKADTGIYSIRLAETILSLQQWDSTINLELLVGKPIKKRIQQLDSNSDTHSGSYTKYLEYRGLKLKLFSPKQNGRTFWVQEIILTDQKYKTTKDIGIGDDLTKVKQAYPALEKFPGNSENMYYIADAGYEKSIEMEFSGNKLIKLRMYYMIP